MGEKEAGNRDSRYAIVFLFFFVFFFLGGGGVCLVLDSIVDIYTSRYHNHIRIAVLVAHYYFLLVFSLVPSK